MGEHKSAKAILDEQDHRALATWAADCAGHVLPTFEKMVPHDNRPRKAIEAARLWVQGALPMVEARKAAFAAHAAARDAQDVTAQLAARAAGHAAATAHVADHARHAADYALKAVASAKSPGDAAVAERDWQYQRLPERLRPVIFPSPVSGDPPTKKMI
jgi:hypothetical protein